MFSVEPVAEKPVLGSTPSPIRPVRVQLSRAKGWRMPPNTVKVDRGTGYGNPWYVGAGRVKLHSGQVVSIGPTITAAGAVDRFRRWMRGELGYQIGDYVRHPLFDAVLCPGAPPSPNFLRGKNLACWCKIGAPCHADVLLELANDGGAGVPVHAQADSSFGSALKSSSPEQSGGT